MTLASALVDQALEVVSRAEIMRIAIVGLSATAFRVRTLLLDAGFEQSLIGIFDPDHPDGIEAKTGEWNLLLERPPDLIIIAADERKEELLLALKPISSPAQGFPEVVMDGTGHLEFSDPVFDELEAPSLVPSYATGYANTRVHLFQCLKAAAAKNLEGVIAEFGAFKGGTTAWLARAASSLGLSSSVLAFDSWEGFPPRRSILDLYTHPRCVFTRIEEVQSYLQPLGVELVAGDISETAGPRLAKEKVLLAFIDTDNYSPARAAIDAVLPRLVPGGSIVFDHYTTTSDYVYTVGERLAAKEMLEATGLLQLHGTGVFVKI